MDPDKNRSLIRQFTVPIEPGLKINGYQYGTKEAGAAVLTAGYFNFARGYLRPGDRIEAMTEVDDPDDTVTLRLKVMTVPVTGDVTVEDLDAE